MELVLGTVESDPITTLDMKKVGVVRLRVLEAAHVIWTAQPIGGRYVFLVF